MNLYTIPPTLSFVDALAKGLLQQAGGDPIALSKMTVLLPNRRACRNLREAFLRESDGRPLLLPAIRPIGDVDEENLWLGPAALAPDIRPQMEPLRRQLVLAQYLVKAQPNDFTIAQAMTMAADLARFLDSVHTEGLSLDGLENLVAEQYAAHWQISLSFLRDVLRVYWPRFLEAENASDPSFHRIAMIKAYTQNLIDHPPRHPVIAAGSTGSIPASADLLKVVAKLPGGMVVLPGLDTLLDDESWKSIEEGHPQAGLARLLHHFEADRVQVRIWPGAENSARERLISTLMRPAASLKDWTDHPAEKSAFNNLHLIEADTLDEEASTIALIMRDHVKAGKGDHPCVLVTPDRILASRVAQALKRWDITIDDSAGLPLAQTPIGSWLLLLIDMLNENLAPVPLLAALKHPFAAGGKAWPQDAPPYRNFVRMLDRDVLRGSRPAPGFAGLLQRAEDDSVCAGLRHLEKLFTDAFNAKAAFDRFHALITLAENLTQTSALSGAQRLWQGDAGEAAAQLIALLLEQRDVLPELDWAGCRAVLEAAMKSVSVRPRFGTHPGLAILGPIEARLYHSKTMILSGLNEGAWPRMADVDGWMSRPMRRDFGLPAPERAITLSAHDFTQGLGAQNVYLTRSKNRDGAPAVPSRWIQRLDAVAAASGDIDIRMGGTTWLAMARALDTPLKVVPSLSRAQYSPPLSSRPLRLSVTEIADLRRDPYGIYAKRVLGLLPLDPIDAEPDAGDRGTLIHKALENYTKAFPKNLPVDAYDYLKTIGEKVFASAQAHPDVTGHWWPRFLRMARALTKYEATWRDQTQNIWAEIKSEMPIETKAGYFTLVGKADRIERRHQGWAVIDYKTGTPPDSKNVLASNEPQLTLLGAMLLGGFFNDALDVSVTPETLDTLSYWPAGGSRDVLIAQDIDPKDQTLEDVCKAAREGLENMVRAYLEEGIPYLCWPDSDHKLREGYEYAHLARIAEWLRDDDTSEAA